MNQSQTIFYDANGARTASCTVTSQRCNGNVTKRHCCNHSQVGYQAKSPWVRSAIYYTACYSLQECSTEPLPYDSFTVIKWGRYISLIISIKADSLVGCVIL